MEKAEKPAGGQIRITLEPDLQAYVLGLKEQNGLETVVGAVRVAIRQGMAAVPLEGATAQLQREALNEARQYYYGRLRDFFDALTAEMHQ